ncbi:hypothetical protein NHQ30_010896 [Ciborinia camelliae]|nr:hypothetical protein NHQ30_010896 [Ciborinia camelliae]
MHQTMIATLLFVSGAMAATYSIDVGTPQDQIFVPSYAHIQVGDQVRFFFWGNHSVAQSTFDNPCVPSDHDPIFSGVIPGPPAQSDDNIPVWVMNTTINETLWLYSSVGDDCQKGMSLKIDIGNNPDINDTIEEYQAAAALIKAASAPTETNGGTIKATTATGSSPTSTGKGTYTATTATTTALSTTFTSKASTVTATKSGSSSGSASATGSASPVTATGAAGKANFPVALGLAGIAGGLAALMA